MPQCADGTTNYQTPSWGQELQTGTTERTIPGTNTYRRQLKKMLSPHHLVVLIQLQLLQPQEREPYDSQVKKCCPYLCRWKKISIFKSLVIPVLLYGCEMWAVNTNLKRWTDVCGTRCLCRIMRYCCFVWNQQLLRETDSRLSVNANCDYMGM